MQGKTSRLTDFDSLSLSFLGSLRGGHHLAVLVHILGADLLADAGEALIPSTIILCMGVSLLIIYFPVFFLVGDPNGVRCVDPVTQSLPGDNKNWICQFQCKRPAPFVLFVSFYVFDTISLSPATMLIYGYLSLVIWFLLLVVNIYMVSSVIIQTENKFSTTNNRNRVSSS